MVIKVAVAGAGGRMGSLVVSGILKNDKMRLVAGFNLSGAGKELAPGIIISSPDEMEERLKFVKPEVLVDFTNPDSAVANVKAAARNRIKLVVGTTGFSAEQFKTLEKAITGNVPAIISPNFAIGVNVFWRLIAEAARELCPYKYHMEIIEMHHAQKKDAPSGTAIKAAEIIADCGALARRFVHGRQGIIGERTADEIGVHAVRAGEIVGEHTVLYVGKGERLEITHRAQSREAFAHGAIMAIEWISGKTISRIYSIDEMLTELGGKKS